MRLNHYTDNVFINCPFDLAYKPLFDAIVFAVHDCGFIAHCALDEEDTSQVRIEKIYNIIEDCRLDVESLESWKDIHGKTKNYQISPKTWETHNPTD